MTDFIANVSSLWEQYGGMILGIGGTILAVGGTILTLYLKLKPVFDALKEKIDAIFNKTNDEVKEDITTTLQSVTLDSKITDLKTKLENPTISDTLKQEYLSQLEVLLSIKAKLDAGLVTVTDTTDKYL